MSAMNCYVNSDAIHVFTDGALFDSREMKLTGIANKVAALTRYNAVIVATGYNFITTILGAAVAEESDQSFDELVGHWSEIVRKTISRSPACGGPGDWADFELILAGWSESKNEPQAFVLNGRYKDGRVPFATTEITRYRSPDHPYFLGYVFDPDNASESGLELLRAQRGMKWQTSFAQPAEPSAGGFIKEAGPGHHVIGGFAQHTVVTRDSITMRVLERWPDVIDAAERPNLTPVPEPAND